MGRRTYDAAKIGQTKALLVSNAGYVKPTAQTEGLSPDTVTRWRDGEYPKAIDPKDIELETTAAIEELAEWWSKVARLGAQVTYERLQNDPKLSGYQAAVIGAIGTDKANLLRGKPTARVETVDLATFLRQQAPAQGPDRPLTGTARAPEPPSVSLDATKQH